MRSITRIERVGINTVARLLCDAGEVCQEYHDRHVRGLTCTDIQADEIWSYVYAYDRNLDEDQLDDDIGGCWTWTAIASDSKLMICWLVGGRDLESAILFMRDLKSRVVTHTQLSSDSYPAYGEAVYLNFGPHVDYGQVTKQFRAQKKLKEGEKEVDSELKTVIGNPDRRKISTSYVERMNLSIRMAVRRFGRADECVQQEDRPARACPGALLYVLQFLPSTFGDGAHAGDGRRTGAGTL